MTATRIADRYAEVLESYLSDEDEAMLREAYEVGRCALEQGLAPLVLFSIHRDVVHNLPPSALDSHELVSRATAVFVEALAPFHMSDSTIGEARHVVDALGEAADTDGVREQLERIERTAEARRRLIADIVAAQEEERRRIAGEIHDDAVQAMTAVLLRLGLLTDRLDDPAQISAVRQLEATVADSIGRLRRLVASLSPPELDRAGLAPAVRAVLEQLRLDFGLDCVLHNHLAHDPAAETRAIVFRIVQEALANVRKHARAIHVEVRLETTDGGVCANVVDDGIGFLAAEALARIRPGTAGLAAMRERAELAGGWLSIESRPGATKVTCWIPDAHG